MKTQKKISIGSNYCIAIQTKIDQLDGKLQKLNCNLDRQSKIFTAAIPDIIKQLIK
jgi:hypothetical protein